MINWEQEQRQAPIGLILFFLHIVRVSIKAFWPILIILFVKDSSEAKSQIYFYLFIVVLLFLVIASVFSYLFFKFQIIDDELIVKRGFLHKSRVNIPFERIQTINITQNILQKLLNLVSVNVDTAGSKGNEIKFIALKKEVAEEMETLLGHYKKEQAFDEQEEILQKESKFESILSLNSSTLMRVGLSENHLRSFFIILAFGYGIFNQVRDVFQDKIDALADQSMKYAQALALSSVVVLTVLTLVISILFSLIRVAIFFYKLKMSKTEDAIKVEYGLLNKKVWNIPVSKVQVISFHHNPIRRFLRFSTLKIKQAVSSENIQKKQSIWVPACTYKASGTLQELILEPNNYLYSGPIKPHSVYFRIRLIWLSFPFLGVASVLYEYWQTWLIFGFVEAMLFAFIFLFKKKKYAQISDNNLYISKGAVSQTERFVSLYKVQAVSLKQNIFQRRRSLCTLLLYTASGDVLTVPHINESFAKDLQSYILYKVQTCRKSWM